MKKSFMQKLRRFLGYRDVVLDDVSESTIKLEVGKFYRHLNNQAVYLVTECDSMAAGYGRDYRGEWFEESLLGDSILKSDTVEEIDEKEFAKIVKQEISSREYNFKNTYVTIPLIGDTHEDNREFASIEDMAVISNYCLSHPLYKQKPYFRIFSQEPRGGGIPLYRDGVFASIAK